ncbi:E3 ubiquitin-protein ligase UHRF1-like [Danaus plexippus]|uniref:E3 ubiquitin-protein ligase UHRF1-like n=1 Tax=Danaus plexippus TaxID=13037 RepID=UPI002AAFEB98|nr:E3 ubiquitin-protein ligase UHRF1-like [Danaus plexippus]
MHVRVRMFGKPDTIVVVESKLTKLQQFRRIIKEKFDVEPKLQRLFYGGKLLEDGYTFHDYNIKLNDVIQLIAVPQTVESEDEKKSLGNQEQVKESDFEEKTIVYTDVTSTVYAVGDLVDVKDREQGAWLEGKIIRIVLDPKVNYENEQNKEDLNSSLDNKNDLENKPPSNISEQSNTQKIGIAKYFTKQTNGKRLSKDFKVKTVKVTAENVLYKVQLDDDEEDSELFCKLKEIRPRARHEIDVKDLKPGQKVMINHNTDEPLEKGYWYDFKVDEIKKLRTSYEIVGTLYLGPDSVPQNDTKVKIHDKIFTIEEPVPLEKRTEDYLKSIQETPAARSKPLNCLKCRDNEEEPCKECGCYLCAQKNDPDKIILCDECHNGYHMVCLKPPLTVLPDDDWYCPSCKRDPNDVIAPGASKQAKKSNTSKTNRDWGRGMACVGKTKTCPMPLNHFGPIPGIEVGMCWRFRIQLSESGVHRPPVSGIHGRDIEGAYSIVLSGGYEDDVDNGYEFTYTGSGGRNLSGNKRTAEQSCDQTLTRENKALARNCAVDKVSEDGGDAGDDWRRGKPVRVVRSCKMMKHFPKYAPQEGIRYDGIYKVVKYYPERGLSGYIVWKYLLRRDDPSPAPWETGAKKYNIVYPDGYLEAEAEKKALKEKATNSKKSSKRVKRNESSSSETDSSPVVKKRKVQKTPQNGKVRKKQSLSDSSESSSEIEKSTSKDTNPKKENRKSVIPSIFTKSPKNKKVKAEEPLSGEEKDSVMADTLNSKLWGDCLDVCEKQGKKEFIEHVTQVFLCIICQDVAVNPVTTPCSHNFCIGCLKLAFKSSDSQGCPCCRQSLAKMEVQVNEQLKKALQTILKGYDAGKK